MNQTGWSQQAVDAGEIRAEVVMLPLAGNARAKLSSSPPGASMAVVHTRSHQNGP